MRTSSGGSAIVVEHWGGHRRDMPHPSYSLTHSRVSMLPAPLVSTSLYPFLTRVGHRLRPSLFRAFPTLAKDARKLDYAIER